MAGRKAPRYGPNGAAARKAVRALKRAKAVDDTHAALVEAFVTLADMCDSPDADEGTFREYRMMGRELREVSSGGDDDAAAEFVLSITTPGRA